MSVTKQSACGVIDLVQNTQPGLTENLVVMAILVSLIRFSSRLTVNNITCGEQLAKMERLLMYIFKNDEMVRQQNVSLGDYGR